MDELEYLEENRSDEYDKAIVFIHGWKGNKDSFTSLSSILKIKNAKWFFPQAPYRISDTKYSWSFQHSDQSWEYKEPIRLLNKFLNDKILNHLESKNVFFIGFSQGATVCYDLVLQLEYAWGGVFPVSGFTRDKDREFTIHKNQFKTPIIIGHGLMDDIVPITSSERIFQDLNKKSFNVSFEKFNGGHKISIDYLKKIQTIISG